MKIAKYSNAFCWKLWNCTYTWLLNQSLHLSSIFIAHTSTLLYSDHWRIRMSRPCIPRLQQSVATIERRTKSLSVSLSLSACLYLVVCLRLSVCLSLSVYWFLWGYLKKSILQKSWCPSREKHLSSSGHWQSWHLTHDECHVRSTTVRRKRSTIGPSHPAHNTRIFLWLPPPSDPPLPWFSLRLLCLLWVTSSSQIWSWWRHLLWVSDLSRDSQLRSRDNQRSKVQRY